MAKIWQDVPVELFLEVHLDNISHFQLPDGFMASEYVEGDIFPYKFIMCERDCEERMVDYEELTKRVLSAHLTFHFPNPATVDGHTHDPPGLY